MMRIPKFLVTAFILFHLSESVSAQSWQTTLGSFYSNSPVAANYGTGFTQLWHDNAIVWKYGNTLIGGLRFASANDLGGNSFTERMRITDNGNVGIGTGNPRGKLDIWSGSIHVTGTDQNGTLIGGSAGGYAYLGCNWLTNGITISTGGSVGIGLGTSTFNDATFKLAVNGSAIFTKVIVKNYSNWPDYVFDSTYNLPALVDVEKYIQQNHHLPEVPSAPRVKTEGIDLGDNQAILLRKTEELTLYAIEQQKMIQELQSKMKGMEEKNK